MIDQPKEEPTPTAMETRLKEISSPLLALSVTGLEREFLEALPKEFQLAGYTAFKQWLKEQDFNTINERSKAKLAYMDAFVTACHMKWVPGEGDKPQEE